MLDLNKHVALSEEFENSAPEKAKSGGLLFDRRVTRIITPGTLVDEKFMDPYENNFLLAIYGSQGQEEIPPAASWEPKSQSNRKVDSIGLAWLDLSTGQFSTQSTNKGALSSELMRIGAREIVMNAAMGEHAKQDILSILSQNELPVTWQPGRLSRLSLSEWAPMLESPVASSEIGHFTDAEVMAGTILLNYVKDRLLGLGMKLQPPIRRQEAESMGIDKNSMRGLEILQTTKDAISGGKGSLLHSMRRTVTKSGARLLKERISSPSASLSVINQRLDLVQVFLEKVDLREDITSLLKRTFDSQRIVQKFSLGRGDVDDLVSLLRTISATQNVVTVLKDSMTDDSSRTLNASATNSLSAILDRLSMDGPSQLAAHIAESIDEEGLMASHNHEQAESASMVSMAQDILNTEGSASDMEAMSQVMRSKTSNQATRSQSVHEQEPWVMRRTASPTLDNLHTNLFELHEEKDQLLSALREDRVVPSLSLRWTPGLGHICHVKGVKDVRASMENFKTAKTVSTSKSTRSFYLPEWTRLGERIDQITIQIKAEEHQIFQGIRENVIKNLVKLRRNAAVLDELDIACSSATLAAEQGFVRPILNDGAGHKIIAGRHPTVKLGLEERGRAFVSNDCFVGDKERVWLVTGPNMAGKSTFLRQNALISILAQVGSYVPAAYAEIGIVDHVFSRIGSADSLYQGQSTFMVEMLETASILKHATPRSFVIMDEVGRGTTPEDGIAVGYACLHHLYNTNRCRTLFATHFHVLADMTSQWSALGRYCTDVKEGSDGSFTYIHNLRLGVNRESHALKVARLAGLPEDAISVARDVLQNFEASGLDRKRILQKQ